MDYSNLSDFEINKRIAEREGVRGFHCENVGGGTALKFSNWKELDYCNNPADAWPIILGHKIIIINADDEWLCVQDGVAIDGVIGESVSAIFSDGAAAHQNPLRAAMIVFLMMQDGE